MSDSDSKTIKYKRSKFSTHLPIDYVYTKSHFWIKKSNECLKIGLTKLAVRMLGELVECEFEIEPNTKLKKGEIIGWVEGLKANSDIYSVVEGTFLSSNTELQENPASLFHKPYHSGWLYTAKAELNEDMMSAHEYVEFLDQTIDKMAPR
jgi:glycine cleavage system H protein